MKDSWDTKIHTQKLASEFLLDDFVWLVIRRLNPSKGKYGVKWIGPCKIILIQPGNLFDLQYTENNHVHGFKKIHPQLLKPFHGQLT